MALDTDYTLPTFNSYVDEATADALARSFSAYFDEAGWTALTSAEKEAFLLQAATEGNTQYRYLGEKIEAVISVQSGGMQFPRSELQAKNGILLPADEIPAFIKDYQVLRSLEFLTDGTLFQGGRAQKGAVKKEQIGTLISEFYDVRSSASAQQNPRSFASFKAIQPYLLDNAGLLLRA